MSPVVPHPVSPLRLAKRTDVASLEASSDALHQRSKKETPEQRRLRLRKQAVGFQVPPVQVPNHITKMIEGETDESLQGMAEAQPPAPTVFAADVDHFADPEAAY